MDKTINVIVAGGRDFNKYNRLAVCLNRYLPKDKICTIVSGGARGADSLGEVYAKNKSLTLMKFPANWDLHGRSAGFIRNNDMAKNAEMLIAFWDRKSKGTQNMIETAIRHKLEVCVFDYTGTKIYGKKLNSLLGGK